MRSGMTCRRRDCSPSAERLHPTLVWHRLVEQRGGLLMHAGTVTPVAFACATLPRRLVNGARQRQRAVTQAELQRTPVPTAGGSRR